MSLVRWSFHNLHVPMLSIDGKLYCTNNVLVKALGTTEDALRMTYMRHKNRFATTSVTFSYAINMLKEHRVELGLKYIRKDIRLWVEDDMLRLAIHTATTQSEDFVEHVIAMIKTNAQRGMVSKETYEKLAEDMADMRVLLAGAMPAVSAAAKAAGVVLEAQKRIQPLLLLN